MGDEATGAEIEAVAHRLFMDGEAQYLPDARRDARIAIAALRQHDRERRYVPEYMHEIGSNGEGDGIVVGSSPITRTVWIGREEFKLYRLPESTEGGSDGVD